MAQHQNSTNKKTIFFLFSLSLVMLISLCMIFLFYPDEQSFDDTLTVSLDRIDKVVMSDLEEPGIYKTTTDPREIRELTQYLDQVTYTQANGHDTGYMPTRAIIIYLFEQDEHNFIVPYEKEAIIAHNVYRVNQGTIDNQFLLEYYDSLNDS